MPHYDLARTLRHQLTTPEFLLWERLKVRGPDRPVFRRQYAIGNYILDFYCKRAKLCVEVDGTQHSEEGHFARDRVRDDWLRSHGIEVYRIPAAEVLTRADEAADGVILLALSRLTNSPHHRI